MTRLVLVGALGRMGRMVLERAKLMQNIEVVAAVDIADTDEDPGCPHYKYLSDVKETADVVIDFSTPATLEEVLQFCVARDIPAVLAVTGYSPEDKANIRHATVHIPIFCATNFSVGVSLLGELAKRAAQIRRNCDIEIIEKHHNNKVDAPSGTALTLADEIASVLPGEHEFVYGREGRDSKRKPGEIGIHAVRGGGVVGEHEILFLSPEEELTITHRAYSRSIFADGALAASVFILHKDPSLYGMHDLLGYLFRTSERTQSDGNL